MKKAIAMIGVFALALSLVGGGALASNQVTATDNDDTISNARSWKSRTVRLNTSAIYNGESVLIFDLNTGNRVTVAGGDVEQNYQEGTGDVSLNVTRNSDINSSLITTDPLASDGDDDNSQTLTGNDDAIFNQESDAEDLEVLNDYSEVNESDYAEVNVNTGGDTLLAGEDVEEEDGDEPDTLGEEASGDISVILSESKFRNFREVRRSDM